MSSTRQTTKYGHLIDGSDEADDAETASPTTDEPTHTTTVCAHVIAVVDECRHNDDVRYQFVLDGGTIIAARRAARDGDEWGALPTPTPDTVPDSVRETVVDATGASAWGDLVPPSDSRDWERGSR